MRPRICCLWLPRFGLHVATQLASSLLAPTPAPSPYSSVSHLRASASICGSSLRLPHRRSSAFIGGSTSSPRIALYRPGTRWQELLECSPALEAAGIRPGVPLKEALARAPDATFLPCDDAALDAMTQAFDRILDTLDTFSPYVESPSRAELADARAAVYLDVSGLEPLYGPEPILAERLAAAVTEVAGTPARAGIASTKFTAWLAATLSPNPQPATQTKDERRKTKAEGGPSSFVLRLDQESLFLAPLPLHTLPLPIQTRLALQRLGIRTLGEYAKLPPNAVAHRYGEPGRLAHRLAQGLDDSPLRPRRLKPAARVDITFDWEETELDRLTFALKILADQLAARLQALDESDHEEGEEELAEATFADESSHSEFWEDENTKQTPPLSGFTSPPDPLSTEWRGGTQIPLHSVERDRSKARVRSSPSEGVRSPQHAADALHITWKLSNGESRDLLLRLAEPSASAASFLEHLRWHAEGLDRFLSEGQGTKNEDQGSRVKGQGGEGEVHYEPIDRRLAVTAITLEAVGIQTPAGTQLKLLTSPLQLAVPTSGTASHTATKIDPATRSRYARRAIARLQARWGPDSVRQATLIPSRLPEHTFHFVDPSLDLQLSTETPHDQSLSGTTSPPDPLSTEWRGGAQIPLHSVERDRPKARVRSSPYQTDLSSPLSPQPSLWLLDSPEPAAILTPRKGGRRVLSRPTTASSEHPARSSVVGRRSSKTRILRHGGPWKLVDPSLLTTKKPLDRHYYQLETEDGRACLAYWDRPANRWFIQGVFD